MRLPFQKTEETEEKGTAKRGSRDKKPKAKGRESDAYTSTPAVILGPRLGFIAAVVVLCVVGLIMIYSASSIESYASSDFGNDSMYFLRKHVMWLGIGVVCCVIAALAPHRFWAIPWVSWGLWGISLVLLVMVIAGFGVSSLGAERSLSFGGMSIQPAEFAKISVLLLMASLLERWGKGELDATFGLVQMLVVVILTAICIYKQPDLGTTIILAFGIICVLVFFGASWQVILFVVAVLVLYAAFCCITQPYHLERIMTLFHPWDDMQGSAYQTTQGFMAFGSGGIFGTGLGLSRQKYLYLPYAYNDFIFAVVGEELGLIGGAFVILLFLVLLFAGLRITKMAPDIFGSMVAGGFTCMITFQAYVNIACVLGLFPVTGKALPFISYGGSSLLATMIMVGLILGVSKDSKLDVLSEARRDNLVVMEGGRSAQRQQGRGQQAPSAPSLGTIIAGFGGAVSGIAERAASASRQQSQPRGTGRKGDAGRKTGARSGYAQQPDRYGSSRRASEQRRQQQQQPGSSRSSRRRSDLDIELVDIAPKTGRPERQGVRGTGSRSGGSRTAGNGGGRGSSRSSTGSRKAPSGGAPAKGRISYGDASKRSRNNRRR